MSYKLTMPSRNVVKQYAPENYYHVFNRGVAKLPIFLDSRDREHFMKILKRHLDPDNKDTRSDGLLYKLLQLLIEDSKYLLNFLNFCSYEYQKI